MKMHWMAKSILGSVTALTMVGSASQVAAAEVSVSGDLVSAYVFRGDTFNDGLVFQPGCEISSMKLGETALPLTLGVWGNLDIDDYDGALEDGEFSELDIYLSVDIPLPVEMLSMSVGYCEYAYPTATTEADVVDPVSGEITTAVVGLSADREVNLGVSVDTLLAPSLTLYYGVDGGIDETFYAEAAVGHSFDVGGGLSIGIEAKAGYLVPESGSDGFNDLVLTASASWKALTASVSYIGQLDDDVLVGVEDDGGYDVDVVGKIGLAQSF